MVVMNVGEKESLAYLSSRQVFPTPTFTKVQERFNQKMFSNLSGDTAVGKVLTTIADHEQLDLHIESIISSGHFNN